MEGVERELAAAMRAALPLEAPYRLNFIGRYLLAQLAGEALPTVTNGLSTDDLARKMLMTTELEEELQRASEWSRRCSTAPRARRLAHALRSGASCRRLPEHTRACSAW